MKSYLKYTKTENGLLSNSHELLRLTISKTALPFYIQRIIRAAEIQGIASKAMIRKARLIRSVDASRDRGALTQDNTY